MALSVTANLTLLSNCDALTGWVIGTRGELITDLHIQGSGCIGDWVDATTGTMETYTIGTATDMTGQHLYVWVYVNGIVDTKANGGYRLYAESSTGNSKTWYVGGNDTHGTGWQLLTLDFAATATSSAGTFDITSVTKVGLQFKTLTNAPIKGQTRFMNCLWDVVRYGTGLTITSASTDDITLEDIFAIDDSSTNKYGVVTKSSGAYVLNGTLTFGGTTAETCDMVIDGEAILYPDNPFVSTSFNTLKALGNSTGTTNVQITGSFIKANNVAGAVDFDGTNLDDIDILGSTITNMGACDFTSSQVIKNDVFAFCDAISPNGATFQNNTISDTVAATSTGSLALVSASDLTNISNITFNDYTSKYAVYIPATITGTITLDSFIGDASGTDVYWAATSGTLTINKSNGTNFTTWSAGGTATVSLVTSVSIDVNVQDQAGTDISGAYVYVDEDLDTAGSIENTTTDVNGDVSTSYSGGATSATIRVRKYGYKPYITTISLSSDSQTNVVLITDPQQT